jgi:hypothetical protein
MDSYGFIITRHVNSITTNKYWNHNLKLIRGLYPLTKIVVIDDNSNYDYVKANADYENITIIQSEFPKRGELLPYYYFLKYKFFKNAFIIHDSVFIQKKIDLNKLNGTKVISLWHFEKDAENIDNTKRLLKLLQNSYEIERKMEEDKYDNMMLTKIDRKWYGSFGVQCYINLNFLEYIENKYKITNLVNGVTCRSDRSCLERIMGCIFCIENKKLLLQPSLFGCIFNRKWGYTFNEYMDDLNKRNTTKYVVKVWTGR